MVEDQAVPGLPAALIYEEQVIGPRGPGGSRIVAGSIENIVFLLHFSSVGELWPWDDVTSISQIQADKIRRIVEMNRNN